MHIERNANSKLLFLNISLQLHKILRNKNSNLDWLSIAFNCGFYDYQHLSRVYKDLTGLSPNQFHKIDLNGPERIFGEADTY